MKKNYPDDDERTIADMNVDGMPWYSGKTEQASGSRGEDLTKEQQRMYTWAALKTGLLVALIYGGVFAAFIAICDIIWRH